MNKQLTFCRLAVIGISAAGLALSGVSYATPIVLNGDFANATSNTFFPPGPPGAAVATVPNWSVSGPYYGTCTPCVLIFGPAAGATVIMPDDARRHSRPMGAGRCKSRRWQLPGQR